MLTCIKHLFLQMLEMCLIDRCPVLQLVISHRLIKWGRGDQHINKTDTMSTGQPLVPTTDPCWATGRGSLLNVWTYCSPKLVCDSNCPVSPPLWAALVYPNWNQAPLIRSGCKSWPSWGRRMGLAGYWTGLVFNLRNGRRASQLKDVRSYNDHDGLGGIETSDSWGKLRKGSGASVIDTNLKLETDDIQTTNMKL